MCLTVRCWPQASQKGSSSLDMRYPWVSLVCPILKRFKAVSSFRLRLELSHLKVVDLIWFNLVFWLFHDKCHFFLIYSSNGVFMLEMAILAYVSAVSLPEIPVCPGIHVTSSILFWMRMAMSPGWVLFLTLIMALRESLRIKKLVCGKVFITSMAFRIARASAENIEQSLGSLKVSIIAIPTPLHDFEASMCLTVRCWPQASEKGGSSLDMRYPWVSLVCPILKRFKAVSSFRFRLELSHLKVVDLIWFNLVFWLFQDKCHFFLIYVFNEFLKSL
ncbi:Uncharacterized protein FWK35_00007386 [Aphis craccivora]|uniref:Uncharacterized protein n=1 Tax=Aphis craccivora TaxID=307492 RepID=A0A6G0YF96_APHCR|nr:Uncharacterized protein FWK35_00007386 [Aphis craccivora]